MSLYFFFKYGALDMYHNKMMHIDKPLTGDAGKCNMKLNLYLKKTALRVTIKLIAEWIAS